MLRELASRRIAIEAIDPEIDGGRFAARCVAGRPLRIECDAFCDGHDVMRAALRWRARGARQWHEVEMAHIVNDRWGAEITVPAPGPYEYTFVAWRDLFGDWHRGTVKKLAAGQECAVEAEEGRLLVAAAEAARPAREHRTALKALAKRAGQGDLSARLDALMDQNAVRLMHAAGPRTDLTELGRTLPLMADRELAAASAWYELFPRSQGAEGVHGTWDDVIARLPYVAGLGFDVLYFPPIHPIGTTNRKGRNNSLRAEPGDPGSPYAIGSPEGGFCDVHPELGTLEDFGRMVAAAREVGIEIAIDIALNASPDHPWVKEHPTWFDRRPTAPSSTPRTRPRSTRTSSTSATTSPTAPPTCRSGRRSGTCFCSGSVTGSRSSGWTTRTPSRSRSGSGSSARCGPSIPRRSSWPRRSPGPRS